jgi:hypothetical protein
MFLPLLPSCHLYLVATLHCLSTLAIAVIYTLSPLRHGLTGLSHVQRPLFCFMGPKELHYAAKSLEAWHCCNAALG